MMTLIVHELRIATRRASWPWAFGLHLTAAALFVAVWGPTNGLPLWSAPMLAQLVAADRLLVAVLLTWLVTPLFAPDRDVDLLGWSSVAGVSVNRVMAARALAAIVLALVMVAAALPVAVVAGQISAATPGAVAEAVLDMAGFSLLAVGLAAAAALACRGELVVWCTAMALSTAAAFAVRPLPLGPARVAVCVLIAVAAIVAVADTADRRARWIEEPRA